LEGTPETPVGFDIAHCHAFSPLHQSHGIGRLPDWAAAANPGTLASRRIVRALAAKQARREPPTGKAPRRTPRGFPLVQPRPPGRWWSNPGHSPVPHPGHPADKRKTWNRTWPAGGPFCSPIKGLYGAIHLLVAARHGRQPQATVLQASTRPSCRQARSSNGRVRIALPMTCHLLIQIRAKRNTPPLDFQMPVPHGSGLTPPRSSIQ
jgi:hypothetical protein